MPDYVLCAKRIATPHEIVPDGFVVVEGGSVLDVGRGLPPAGAATVDLGDVLIAPGFIDVHVHGGGGAQVNCATREEVEKSVRRMAQFHAQHGTTALVPTTVSDSPEALTGGGGGGGGCDPCPWYRRRRPWSSAPTSRGPGSPARGREHSSPVPYGPLRLRSSMTSSKGPTELCG